VVFKHYLHTEKRGSLLRASACRQ